MGLLAAAGDPGRWPWSGHEYKLPTPGATNRGIRRLVVGQKGEVYYIDNH